jgi:hypothetical protein
MHIEGMLQSLYAFFFTQSKKGVGICEPCKDTRNKRLEIITKYKISLDTMLNPLKCVLGKYKSLVVKMHIDARKSKLA